MSWLVQSHRAHELQSLSAQDTYIRKEEWLVLVLRGLAIYNCSGSLELGQLWVTKLHCRLEVFLVAFPGFVRKLIWLSLFSVTAVLYCPFGNYSSPLSFKNHSNFSTLTGTHIFMYIQTHRHTLLVPFLWNITNMNNLSSHMNVSLDQISKWSLCVCVSACTCIYVGSSQLQRMRGLMVCHLHVADLGKPIVFIRNLIIWKSEK